MMGTYAKELEPGSLGSNLCVRFEIRLYNGNLVIYSPRLIDFHCFNSSDYAVKFKNDLSVYNPCVEI